MIYSLKGSLILKEPNLAVVECGGVGFACRTTLNTISSLGAINTEAMLYTYLNVREDSMEIFGFSSQQELSCFKLLLSVSGVGPKAALSILSDVSHEQFALTIATGDSKAFTKVKGIGTKTAQRIVLELKDKIAKENVGTDFEAVSVGINSAEPSAVSEAIEGLMVLGFTQSEVMPIISKLDKDLSSSDLIREALRIIGSRK